MEISSAQYGATDSVGDLHSKKRPSQRLIHLRNFRVFRQRDNSELPLTLLFHPLASSTHVSSPILAFVNMLNEIRMGRVSSEANATFTKLSRKVHYDDGVEPTSLFAKRQQVLNENNRRLKQLPGHPMQFIAREVSGKSPDAPYKELFPKDDALKAFLDKVRATKEGNL